MLYPVSFWLMVENIHFLPDTPPETAGKKLMNRNLSDIAAMGGTPLTALPTVSVNGKTSGLVESCIKGASDAKGVCITRFGVFRKKEREKYQAVADKFNPQILDGFFITPMVLLPKCVGME